MKTLTLLLFVMLLTLNQGINAQSSDPANTSSYTLADLYNRLNAGTAGLQSTFTEPTSAPGLSTMYTLNLIMGKAPVVDNTNGVLPAEVLTGKTFWSLRTSGGTWGKLTGSMPNRGAVTYTPGTSEQAVAAGYHNGSGKVEGDADLVEGNIKSGANIFGVAGNTNVVNTSSGDAGAAQILSGKIAWVDGSEVTGTMPARFTDNGNNTVTDNRTGLMWAQDANLPNSGLGHTPSSSYCLNLELGGANDWRLPTIYELSTLVDYLQSDPALPVGHPFRNVQSFYWSNSEGIGVSGVTFQLSGYYYVLLTIDGAVTRSYQDEGNEDYFTWPVRGAL